jgi:hypothetical protein
MSHAFDPEPKDPHFSSLSRPLISRCQPDPAHRIDHRGAGEGAARPLETRGHPEEIPVGAGKPPPPAAEGCYGGRADLGLEGLEEGREGSDDTEADEDERDGQGAAGLIWLVPKREV